MQIFATSISFFFWLRNVPLKLHCVGTDGWTINTRKSVPTGEADCPNVFIRVTSGRPSLGFCSVSVFLVLFLLSVQYLKVHGIIVKLLLPGEGLRRQISGSLRNKREFKTQTFPILNPLSESYLYFRNTLTSGTIIPVVEWRHWWGFRKSLGGTFCTHLKECVSFISYVHRDLSNFMVINDCITSSGKTSRDLGSFRTGLPPYQVCVIFFIFLTSPDASYVLVAWIPNNQIARVNAYRASC